MAIEFKKPVREDYATDTEYIEAIAASVRHYNNRMMHAIDRASVYATLPVSDSRRNKLTAREREIQRADSIHDYLASRPLLLKRYKEIGPAALLEL